MLKKLLKHAVVFPICLYQITGLVVYIYIQFNCLYECAVSKGREVGVVSSTGVSAFIDPWIDYSFDFLFPSFIDLEDVGLVQAVNCVFWAWYILKVKNGYGLLSWRGCYYFTPGCLTALLMFYIFNTLSGLHMNKSAFLYEVLNAPDAYLFFNILMTWGEESDDLDFKKNVLALCIIIPTLAGLVVFAILRSIETVVIWRIFGWTYTVEDVMRVNRENRAFAQRMELLDANTAAVGG